MIDEDGRILDWARVQATFHAALELLGEQRARYLDEACGDDSTLRAEVESLLAHATAGLLGEPAPGPPTPELSATEFGDYLILRPLGQGGMGSVYLAERTGTDFTQRVALKLLRRDLFHPLGSTPGPAQRFVRERQILARLEHPGIARLIDGGYGPGGQPYLAMEYVEGDALTTFVERQQLGVEARLELFIAICEAVHYAHQRLVIHRDLKPSNIVISASGDPRLLDFGIATLVETDEQPSGGTSTTRTGLWFTPSYASPEQVRGERVSILSDIYSLGVLLYELLAGVRPYEIVDLTPAGVEKVVCAQIPERPSTRVSAPPLARRLRGDLDTIALKALAKEPERRYRSAQDLAEDLRRHLNHEPVSARPDSLGYRMRTFARRHRAAATGAALALVALTAGLITTSWQARVAAAARQRAEAALGQSEQVTAFLVGLFQESDPNVSTVNATFVAKVLERGAARLGELNGQPAVQGRLLDAMGQVLINMGRYEEARSAITRGLAIRRQEFGEEHAEVAAGLRYLGRLERVAGRYPEAEALYRQSLDILRRTAGTETAAYVDALSDLAFLLPYMARTPEADSLYREALAIRRRILKPNDPLIPDAMMRVSGTLRALGRFEAAESVAREALTLRQQALGPLHPAVAQTLVQIADIVTLTPSRWAEAESLYRGGIALGRRALGGEHLGLAHGLGNLAELLRRQRRYPEAESLLQAVLELRLSAYGPTHPTTITDQAIFADIWADQGRVDDAIAARRKAIAALVPTFGGEHMLVTGQMHSLALLHLQKGELAPAESLLQLTVDARMKAHGPNHLHTARSLADLGKINLRRGQYALAATRLDEALKTMIDSRVVAEEELGMVRADLAAALRALGRPEDAAKFEPADSS